MNFMEELMKADKAAFKRVIENSSIDALLLYTGANQETIPFFFWQDHYPNGGTEQRIHIDRQNFEDLGWQSVYYGEEWRILLK